MDDANVACDTIDGGVRDGGYLAGTSFGADGVEPSFGSGGVEEPFVSDGVEEPFDDGEPVDASCDGDPVDASFDDEVVEPFLGYGEVDRSFEDDELEDTYESDETEPSIDDEVVEPFLGYGEVDGSFEDDGLEDTYESDEAEPSLDYETAEPSFGYDEIEALLKDEDEKTSEYNELEETVKNDEAEKPADTSNIINPDTPNPPTPTLPDDTTIETLHKQLTVAKTEAAHATDQWKRTAAELANYRQRTTRDRKNTQTQTTARIIEKLLPVLDSFDLALSNNTTNPEPGTEQAFISGMKNTQTVLLTILASEGLTTINTENTTFDPAFHEAIHITEGEGTMIVTSEIRKGYILSGQVIRASLVSVGYQPSTQGNTDNE